MHTLRGPPNYPFQALKYLSSLMFFWPSVKGHSHITEEMPQILASGLVSLYFSGTVTTVGLFFPLIFFTVQSTQAFLHKQERTVVRPEAIMCFCSVLRGRTSLNGLLFQREPRIKKQTNRIPQEHKLCVKSDPCKCTRECVINSNLRAVSAPSLTLWDLGRCVQVISSVRGCSLGIFLGIFSCLKMFLQEFLW